MNSNSTSSCALCDRNRPAPGRLHHYRSQSGLVIWTGQPHQYCAWRNAKCWAAVVGPATDGMARLSFSLSCLQSAQSRRFARNGLCISTFGWLQRLLADNLDRAMGDGPLLVAVVLAGWCTARALVAWQASAHRRLPISTAALHSLLWFNLAGMFAGLAAASKLNGISVLGGTWIVAVGLCWTPWIKVPFRFRLSFAALAMVTALVSAVLAFVLVNPHLYTMPFQRSWDLLVYRENSNIISDRRNSFCGHCRLADATGSCSSAHNGALLNLQFSRRGYSERLPVCSWSISPGRRCHPWLASRHSVHGHRRLHDYGDCSVNP